MFREVAGLFFFDRGEPAMKQCTKCGQIKPRYAFYPHAQRPGCVHSECKDCGNRAAREYKKKHPDRVRKTNVRQRIKQYGLTPDSYALLLDVQGGGCAICGVTVGGVRRKLGVRERLHVDHDHGTGRVRGLLCGKCNRGVGLFNDQPLLLLKAAEYVAKGSGA